MPPSMSASIASPLHLQKQQGNPMVCASGLYFTLKEEKEKNQGDFLTLRRHHNPTQNEIQNPPLDKKILFCPEFYTTVASPGRGVFPINSVCSFRLRPYARRWWWLDEINTAIVERGLFSIYAFFLFFGVWSKDHLRVRVFCL